MPVNTAKAFGDAVGMKAMIPYRMVPSNGCIFETCAVSSEISGTSDITLLFLLGGYLLCKFVVANLSEVFPQLFWSECGSENHPFGYSPLRYSA